MKRKGVFLGVGSGILLAVTVFPLHWKWLVWPALVPLLLAVRSRPFWPSFRVGLWTGFLYFAVYLSWIPYYNPLIFILAVPSAALFFGSFAGLVSYLVRRYRSPLLHSLIPALVWLALEFVYGLTPLGAEALHLESIQSRSLLQLIPISGVSLVTGFILLMNGFLAYGIIQGNMKSRLGFLALLGLLILGWTYGSGFLTRNPLPSGTLPVACVQPNFPMSQSWRSAHEEEIFGTYRQMALEAGRKGAKLIVFPQYNLPVDIYREPKPISEIARLAKAYLILGTYTADSEGKGKYNVALVFSPQGNIVGEYRAVRPPPFRRVGQIKGKQYTVIETPLGKLGILLCYDDVDPKVARELVRQGAEILVTLMNNGHFKKSKLLYLHFMRDILRAVETRRYVIRSATTGISAVIDSQGRVLARSAMEEKGVVMSQVSPHGGQTVFVRYGDLMTPVVALLASLMIFTAIFRTPRGD